MDTCPACGSSVSANARFCHQCGSSLHDQRPGAEYRFVTILCTDLSGYSTLSERLDHEELRTFMDKVLSEITLVIRRFGGIVEKYIGDAVLAIFGTAKAREDDPIRGILAAREIHKIIEGMNNLLPKTCSTHLSMHTGINTGEVLMDSVMAGHTSHGTLGKPINIASRLCDLASEDEILISEALVSEAMRYFHLEWMGRKMLKGFRKPLHVYKVANERSVPLAVHRVGGVTSPLVGREQELSILLSRARELLSGRGGVIGLIGEAGVGKSRLLQEFKAALDERISCFATTCFEYASTTPYFPFSTLIQSIFGLDLSSKDIPRALTVQGLSKEDASQLAFIMDMDSASGFASPGAIKEKGSDAMLWLFNSVALRRRTVFLIEDIHWADQSSLDLLRYVIHKWDQSCPCLLILTQRTSFGPDFSNYRVFLRELNEPEVGRMLRHMFDAALVSEKTVNSLAQAAGGNPFFVEELANYLLEKGYDLSAADPMEHMEDLPTTLYGLISSRLDHMKPSSKRLLQEAALIGRIFPEDLLTSVCSDKGSVKDGLCESAKHGFIRPLGDGRYIFKHEITRDVAGRTLLKKERIMLHGKIALTLEGRCGPGLKEHACELAYHFGQAQEYAKAVHYHMEAGRHCEASGAWVEAGAHFVSAEQCVRGRVDIHQAEELLVTIQEGIWRCSRVFDPVRAITALDDLMKHYRHKGLKEEEAFCIIRLINLYSQRGMFDKARECYRNSLDIIPGHPVLVAAAQTAYAYTYTFLGRPLDALNLLEKARPVLYAADPFLYAVNMLTTLAASIWKGDIQEARFWYCQTKGHSGAYMDIDLMADMWLAHICYLEGSFDDASRIFEDVSSREKKLGTLAGGLTYLRTQASIYFRCQYLDDFQGARSDLEAFDALGELDSMSDLKGLYRAWIVLGEGDHSLAKDLLNAALPGLKKGVANRVPYALNTLAQAHHLLGELAPALSTAQESIDWNEQRGNTDQLIWALRIFAEVCISQGEIDTALKKLSQAYALAFSTRMKPHQAWVIASLGKLFRVRGEHTKAERCFRKSHRLWKEMGNPVQGKKMEKEVALGEPC